MNAFKLGTALIALATATTTAITAAAQTGPATELPRLETRNGRHAFIVDGAPYLMLAAQANNSSNYPAMLDQVWPTLDRIHANTLEMPIAWQQVEPTEGKFDFSFLQVLLDQARAHDKRVILLWFGTWKNTSYAYTPDWVKLNPGRFPRMKTRDGKDHDVLSAHGEQTLAADTRAFVKVMEYLRDHDPQNTVILVQPQNETGSYRNPRDFSATGNRLFAEAIPQPLARKLGKSGTWAQAFGAQADRAFNTWYVASYVNAMAVAGKKVKPLPMYVNAALAGPSNVPDPEGVASGGPQQDVLDIWKTAAPAIDFQAPDIYDRKSENVVQYLDKYARPDNPLMVPEIGNGREFARFFYPTIGRGGIGFAPFGMDDTGYFNYPLGSDRLDRDTLDAFALPYKAVASILRDWARIAASRSTWGAAKPDDGAAVSTVLGGWKITGTWGEWQFGTKDWTWLKAEPPPWASQPIGGLAVAHMFENEFLLVGDHVRVRFEPETPGAMILRIEEGTFSDGKWVMKRVWNGDQTDYGINLIDRPQVLRITTGRAR
ncbi:beta-galactosidase GanA [Sphingomonas desiccabilis]|nr:beta-galactosidase GanA [Sphingomonas desiccabilis]